MPRTPLKRRTLAKRVVEVEIDRARPGNRQEDRHRSRHRLTLEWRRVLTVRQRRNHEHRRRRGLGTGERNDERKHHGGEREHDQRRTRGPPQLPDRHAPWSDHDGTTFLMLHKRPIRIPLKARNDSVSTPNQPAPAWSGFGHNGARHGSTPRRQNFNSGSTRDRADRRNRRIPAPLQAVNGDPTGLQR